MGIPAKDVPMRLTLSVMLAFGAATLALAQEPPPAETPATQAPAAGAPRGGFTPPSQDPQPYEKVITKDAKSKKGIFTVHQVKDKYYYEIPKEQINREFLWVTQIAKTTNGVGYGGQMLGSRVVRWDRNGNKILLREINYEVVADPKQPIARAVKAANNDAIVMSFPVAAFGPEQSAVIEVTRVFTTDVFEFSAKQRLNATMLDASRSYIERVSPYPENIEAEVRRTPIRRIRRRSELRRRLP
jgi:hypothetical protein